jgi:23S rRNA pseudouridine955/2504/2580 synthase
MMNEIVITTNEAGQRLDKFLRKYLTDMSLGSIYRAIRTKQVVVNGKKSSEKYSLNEGDILKFNIKIEDIKKTKKLDFLNLEYDFQTAYEDNNLLVIEKKSGILVHPDEGSEQNLTDEVLAYLYDKGEYNPENEKTFAPSPCNRLDRNTEGLVIYAKNYESLKALNELIRDGNLEKYYAVLVKGRLKEDIYSAYIIKNEKTNKSTIKKEYSTGAKEIKTRVVNLDTVGQFSYLEIELITGRSHQIRAHLSSLGNPIIGDPKYGDKKLNSIFKEKFGLERQLLIANKIIFKRCPEALKYLEEKTISMQIPPLFKKIKNDILKI